MGQQKYPRDPADPAFPHGTNTGYKLRCKCAACRRAVARNAQERKLRRLGNRIGPSDWIDAAPVIVHLRRLMEATPTGRVGDVAALTGVSKTTLVRLLQTPPPKRVFARTARAIRAASPAALTPTLRPRGDLDQRVYSLVAMGYPVTWIHMTAGVCPAPSHKQWVRHSTWAAVDQVYRAYGHIPAESNPDAGITASQAKHARSLAARKGYYPPGCYDDDGNLIPGAARTDEHLEERLAKRDARARRELGVLRLSLAGATSDEIMFATGARSALIQKVRSTVGLQFEWDPVAERTLVRAGYEARAAEVKAVIDAFDDDPTADPYEAAYKVGLMQAATWRRLSDQVIRLVEDDNELDVELEPAA